MTNDKQVYVDEYTAAGFTLFSCGRGKENKSPRHKGWADTPFDPCLEPDDIDDYYGVVPRADIAVIDYDPRRDPLACVDGKTETATEPAVIIVPLPTVNQLTNFCKALKLPKLNTPIVETGGYGLHIYLKLTKEQQGEYTHERIKQYPAIEFKRKQGSSTSGKYVMGAGSKHFSGRSYSKIRGQFNAVAECPAAVLSCFAAVRSKQQTGKGSSQIPDTPAAKAKFTRLCANCVPAIENNGGDGRTVFIAAKAKDYGCTEATALSIMSEHFNPRCQPPWELIDLATKVHNGYEYCTETNPGADAPEAAFLETSINMQALSYAANESRTWIEDYHGKDKYLVPVMSNILNHLLLIPNSDTQNPLYGLLRYNDFAKRTEWRAPAPWHKIEYFTPDQTVQDSDIANIKHYLANYPIKQLKLHIGSEAIREAVEIVAHDNIYHPVRDWLSLLQWDKKPRLDTWLTTYAGSPDNAYTREVAKNTLIAAVARVMKPGCKHDHMLVLEAEQGRYQMGKTELIKTLAYPWGADISIDLQSSGSIKDTVHAMQGCWFLEASEMEFLKRTEVAALKRFLTITSDRGRLAYGRYVSDLPRQSIFIGTINPSVNGYLTDVTGNRRFWPVPVADRLDVQKLKEDREQLFAEAYIRYEAGEAWWITNENLVAAATIEQNKRQAFDAWQDVISQWLSEATLPEGEQLTTVNVAYYGLSMPRARLTRPEAERICQVMRALGYVHERARTSNSQIRIWEKPS